MSKIEETNKMLENFLKANKEDHYNFEEEIDYKVSSGSLQLDLQLGGGFGPVYIASLESMKEAKLQSL